MTAQNIKFTYNGIKEAGVLFKGYWSFSEQDANGNPYIIFMYDEYGSLPISIKEYVKVQVRNETDSMTDYFCKDSFVLNIGDERFLEALACCIKLREKFHERKLKKNAEYYGKKSNEETIAFMKDLFEREVSK